MLTFLFFYIINFYVNKIGSIWQALYQSSNQQIIIKAINKELTAKQMIIVDGMKYRVYENIINEKTILKYLSKDKNCPSSIIKYVDYFKRYTFSTYNLFFKSTTHKIYIIHNV